MKDMTMLYVSFCDTPQYLFAKIDQKEFELFDQKYQKDSMIGYPFIYEIDAQAWFVVGGDVQQCKLIAALRMITETSRHWTLEANGPYDEHVKEDIDCIMSTFSEKVEEITSEEFIRRCL